MKFQEVEEEYVKNLLNEVYGHGRLLSRIKGAGLIKLGAKFRETTCHDKEGGSLFFSLVGVDREVPHSPLSSELKVRLRGESYVLSIHGAITQIEHKRFLLFWKKTTISLLIHAIIAPYVFSSDLTLENWEEDFAKVEEIIRSFKDDIENVSGVRVDKFEFEKER